MVKHKIPSILIGFISLVLFIFSLSLSSSKLSRNDVYKLMQTTINADSFFDDNTDVNMDFTMTQKYKTFNNLEGNDVLNFNLKSKRVFVNDDTEMITNASILVKQIDEKYKFDIKIYNDNSANNMHGLETWKDILINYMYLQQKNIVPFSVNNILLKVKGTNVLSSNQWFNGLNAKIIYSKTGTSRDIFNNCEELSYYVSKAVLDKYWKVTINSVPYISLTLNPTTNNAVIKWLNIDNFSLNLPCYGFNITNMWEHQNLNKNYEELEISPEYLDKKERRAFSEMLRKKHASFTLLYKTESPYNPNEERNYSYTFEYGPYAFRIPINNGKFVPMGIVLNEVNEPDLFIQQAVQKEIKYLGT